MTRKIDRITDYAQRICDGLIVAGETERLACERHLKDLARQGTETFPYFWDVEKAHDIIDFAEELVVGEGTPQPLCLRGSKILSLEAGMVG